MECGTIAGSPNWYLSQILDCSWDNRVAFGSLTSLVIIDPSQIEKPNTISHSHAGRVLSVSFSPQSHGNCLLSTSDTGEMYVWNLNEKKVTLLHKNSVKCMTYGSWSQADGNLIVCADENGNLLQWKIDSNIVRVKAFKEHSFVVVACCPHDQALVATGTKHGLVCVINIKVTGKEFLLHKLRGHDAEVVALSWCPVRENVINPKNKEDCFLLASSAKEKKIYFWRAGQDGLYEAYADLPQTPKVLGTKLWSCVSWSEPHQLLASTVGGEVYSLCPSKLKPKKSSEKGTKWDRFSDNHMRGHVVVKSSPWAVNSDDDWRKKDVSGPNWVWTCGSDRLLVGISSEKRNSPLRINTIGGPVHAMSISPIDGTSLALGVADKSIRVVNLSEPNFKTMQTFQQKVSGKVMALSWHPSKDGWLAFGTSDGRVGIQFTCSVKIPLLFKPFTKDSIYAMEWGPTLSSIKSYKEAEGDSEEKTPSQYILYSIGGGRIAATDPTYPDKIFEETFKDVLKVHLKSDSSKTKNQSFGLSDMAWKPDFTLLALGDDKGSIYLLNLTNEEELQLVSTFKTHTSLIQDLMWHPRNCTSDQTDESVYSSWLASVSNDVTIRIMDTSIVVQALQGSDDASSIPLPVLDIPCIATLKGHKSRVSKVAWSPHEGGRLLSVSYDQCAQVWDVINRQPLSCFTHHSGFLYACLWSPFNPDIAITAGQDGIICLWSVQDQESKVPIVKNKDGQHFFIGAKEARTSSSGNENKDTEGDSQLQKSKKKREKSLLPLSGPDVLQDDGNLTILRSLLNPAENEQSLIDMNSEANNTNKLPLHYAFFGDSSAVIHYLMKESKNVTKENSFTLDVWRGSPKDAITEAIQNKSLSDYFVSVAPTVSHKLWVEACAAYAEQLKEANEFSKASAYLLAIHKVEDAIMLLAEQGKYRHALAVARCRLPSDDPLIKQILIAWADFNIIEGRHCLAAVCFGSAGEWERAAQLLARKKNSERLLLAAQIMKEKSSDHQTGDFYARECFSISLSLKDWKTIKVLLNLYPNISYLALWAHIYEVICASKGDLTPDNWLKCSSDKPEVFSESSASGEKVTKETTLLSEEDANALRTALVDEITMNTEDTAWLVASCKVTLAFLSAPTLFPGIMERFVFEGLLSQNHNMEAAYRYIVQAMALMYNFHITNMYNENTVPVLLKFCMWLAPKGPFDTTSMFSAPTSSLQSSLRAYLAAGLLLWLAKVESADQLSRSSALETLHALKPDIFSLETLKWFKVDFKLKVLQDVKVKKVLDKKKEDVKPGGKPLSIVKEEESVINLVPLDKMESLSLHDAPSSPVVVEEELEENVCVNDLPKLSGSSTNATEDSEIELLSKWLQEFVEKREKVPNPYLSYSNLIHYIKTVQSEGDDSNILLESYTKFWEELNQSADI